MFLRWLAAAYVGERMRDRERAGSHDEVEDEHEAREGRVAADARPADRHARRSAQIRTRRLLLDGTIGTPAACGPCPSGSLRFDAAEEHGAYLLPLPGRCAGLSTDCARPGPGPVSVVRGIAGPRAQLVVHTKHRRAALRAENCWAVLLRGSINGDDRRKVTT
ncbi:hypothetical protein ON010_g8011 [Phytophthora cinnamomi]|nr:hypothetical protein ON010_g8011 [Phytophthora cinnamomi]